MFSYVIRRLLLLFPIILMVVTIAFLLLTLAPGDPAVLIAGPQATPSQLERIRTELGLDLPLYRQYISYLQQLFQLELGDSMITRQAVTAELARTILPTLELVLLAQLWVILLAIPSGVVAAVKRGSLLDRLLMLTATAGISMPMFWISLLLIYYFSYQLQWFPLGGRGGSMFTLSGLMSLLLPVFSLGSILFGTICRVSRSSMLNVLHEDYVRTAQAKGLSPARVIRKHCLKNAMIPVMTIIGLNFGYLLGGAVVIETVFSWPGMGRLALRAVLTNDFPLLQGIVIFLGSFTVLINLLVDLCYCYLNPQIRYH